jgi:protein-S-isoprenylcysteine O-methyltransferase Ste14
MRSQPAGPALYRRRDPHGRVRNAPTRRTSAPKDQGVACAGPLGLVIATLMTGETDGSTAEPAPPQFPEKRMLSFALFSLLPAVALFACAGDLRWGTGWLYVGTLWVATVGTRVLILRFSPALIAERAGAVRRGDMEAWDRWLMPIIAMFGPLASWIIAGLSFRFGWLLGIPFVVRLGAWAVLVAGSALVSWSMLHNPFFSAVVRIQRDRGQTPISKGPYRFVRHPGYLGMLLANLATPVLLDAPWTFVPIGVVGVVLVLRTRLEDRTLLADLPGYADYTRATRARLLPGLW